MHFFPVNFQPGSPPSRTYEAPTPGYAEAGTPRDGNPAYGNKIITEIET